MSKYGSRKFILAAVVCVVATWCLDEHLIDSADWVKVVLGTAGLYIAGNVAQRMTAKPEVAA